MNHASVCRTAFLLTAAVCLTACGNAGSPLAATAQRAGVALPKASLAQAANATQTLAPLEGALTANRVLAFAHAAAKQVDAKAAFTGLSGNWIGTDGEPTDKGTWTVQYLGSDLAPPKGVKNPYGNKLTRRIAISVDGKGIPTVTVTEVAGLPLGLAYLESPLPELDSSDVLRLVRKERPAAAQHPIERMSLTVHPRDFQVMLWKVGTTTQSSDRPLTINANTGAIVTTPY
ncbi:MAG: hypothetical protein ACK46X_02070 [Candidatus Sericytochromatia bacterium]